MFQIFSLALLWAATTSSHQIFPSTCGAARQGRAQRVVAWHSRCGRAQRVAAAGNR